MEVAILEARISDLEKAIEQSAANHNALIGRLMECKDSLTRLNSVCSSAPVVPAEVCLEEAVGIF